MTNKEITVNGIFLVPIIEEIKEKGSEKELAELSEKIGTLNLSRFKSYPVQYQVEAEKVLCNLLYGKYDKSAYIKFGTKSFERFATSNIGKVMLNLFGNDPAQLIVNVQRLYATVTTGIDITTTEIEVNKYSLHFSNDPYPIGGTEGLIRGFMNYSQVEYELEFIDHGEHDHEYILSWK